MLFDLHDLGVTPERAAAIAAQRAATAAARAAKQQAAAAARTAAQQAAAAKKAAALEAQLRRQAAAKLIQAQKQCKAPNSFRVTSTYPPAWECMRPIATAQPIPVQGQCAATTRVNNGMIEVLRWNTTTQACEWVSTGQPAPASTPAGEPSLPPVSSGGAVIQSGAGYGTSTGATITEGTGYGSTGASIVDGTGYNAPGASIVDAGGYGTPGASIVDNSAPAAASAPEQRMDECDPALGRLLPMTYPDAYGPMTVLRIICG